MLEEYTFPFRLKDVILTENNMETELRCSVCNLRVASLESVVAFSHQIFRKLIKLIVRPTVIGGQIGECSSYSVGWGRVFYILVYLWR